MMKTFHHKKFSADSVMSLVRERSHGRYSGIFEEFVPAFFFAANPPNDPFRIFGSGNCPDFPGKAAELLTEGKESGSFSFFGGTEKLMETMAELLSYCLRNCFDLGHDFFCGMKDAVSDVCGRKELFRGFDGAGKAIAQNAPGFP